MNSWNKQRMQFKTKKNVTEDKENFPENQNYDCLIKKKKKMDFSKVPKCLPVVEQKSKFGKLP